MVHLCCACYLPLDCCWPNANFPQTMRIDRSVKKLQKKTTRHKAVARGRLQCGCYCVSTLRKVMPWATKTSIRCPQPMDCTVNYKQKVSGRIQQKSQYSVATKQPTEARKLT
jgi:hypothetical protein